jgi:hypothetical protein
MPKSPRPLELPPLPVARTMQLDAQEDGLSRAIGSCCNPWGGGFNTLKVREYLGSYAIEIFDLYREAYTGHPEFDPPWNAVLVARSINRVLGCLQSQASMSPEMVKEDQKWLASMLNRHLAQGMAGKLREEKTAKQPVKDAATDRKALWDAYRASFPDERIVIREFCWAAGQHYREWKRWLGGKLKDGSTPDLAFRRILASAKRPHEFNKKPRPAGWE